MKTFLNLLLFLFFLSVPAFAQFVGDCVPDESRNTVRILEGDNSDPSIIRQGDCYYLVHSSFVYTPGLVVYKSYDLVNWTPCSIALDKFTGDVWARSGFYDFYTFLLTQFSQYHSYILFYLSIYFHPSIFGCKYNVILTSPTCML